MDKKLKFEIVLSAIVLLYGLFTLLLIRANVMLTSTSFLAMIAPLVVFIGFAVLWELGLIEATLGIFSAIYKAVEPTNTKAKVIVALVSILYGLFAFYIWGGLLAYLPFFMNPGGPVYGFFYLIFGVIVFVIGYLVLVYILKKLIK